MKNSFKTLTALALVVTSFSFAQQKTSLLKKAQLTSIEVKVDTQESLNTIDWDEMFTIFDGNDDNETISASLVVDNLTVNPTEKSSLVFSDFSITVSGPQSERTELLQKMKKQTKKFKKAINKIIEK